LGTILLAVFFAVLFAFVVVAPRELKQIALAGTWALMAVGAVVSVLMAIFR